MAAREASTGLVLTYTMYGRITDVRIPCVSSSERADNLWLHTCFEAFVSADGSAYYELNFSPSTEWALYQFDSYRTGMRAPEGLAAPAIEVSGNDTSYRLSATLQLERVTALTTERDLGALDLLLVTDVTAKEFVFGKLGGILYNTKEMVLLPMALCGYLWFERALSGLPCVRVGKTVPEGRLQIRGSSGPVLVDVSVDDLRRAFQGSFQG